MKKYEEKISKLNEDEKFTYFLTDEEDGENIHNSRLKLAEENGEKSSSIKIAKEMLKRGIDIKNIMEITKLTFEEIKN